ncbi:MAG: alpha/beta fold hydrolase [Chitinivibrionales bacterium]|nr:alpha/beta fold hydrolase [Chitinivibrionales bacterium]
MATIRAGDMQRKERSMDVSSVKKQMKPLRMDSTIPYPDQIVSYFSFYFLDIPCEHHFGIFESQGYSLAAHVYKPKNPKGTVFFLHGYYDHTGTAHYLFRFLIESGYCVAAYDMPGHGLSSGKRASIPSFELYAAVLNDFISSCAPHLPEPCILMGHSTGCAASYEYLMNYTQNVFRRAIFLAPLVRSRYYHLSKIGYFLMSPFTERMPRWFRHSSHDKKFIEFHRKDPLGCRHFPMEWAKAFYAWTDKISGYGMLSTPLTVIQGSKDDVVEWRYNKKYFEKKAAHLEYHTIKNAHHQLMNENAPYRDRFFDVLKDSFR